MEILSIMFQTFYPLRLKCWWTSKERQKEVKSIWVIWWENISFFKKKSAIHSKCQGKYPDTKYTDFFLPCYSQVCFEKINAHLSCGMSKLVNTVLCTLRLRLSVIFNKLADLFVCLCIQSHYTAVFFCIS